MAAQAGYQTVNFYFAVTFEGLNLPNIDSYEGIKLADIDQFKNVSMTDVDARFQSVTGLEAQIDTETIKEGGENRFEHTLPGRRKYSDLVLKRGLLTPEASSVLTLWCQNAFTNLIVQPVNVVIHLLGEGAGSPQILCIWKVIHAWPKSWKLGELNAERGEVLIETLELSYNRFEFKRP